MSSERQIALLQVITLVKKNKDAIKEVMEDRRIFGLKDDRIQVIGGFYFIINFDLSNEEDISSLDYLDEFNVHNGTNLREYYHEDTKKIDTHISLSKFKSWFAVHAKEIRIMVKKMKDPAFVRKNQLKITMPSPTYAPPSSTTYSFLGYLFHYHYLFLVVANLVFEYFEFFNLFLCFLHFLVCKLFD